MADDNSMDEEARQEHRQQAIDQEACVQIQKLLEIIKSEADFCTEIYGKNRYSRVTLARLVEMKAMLIQGMASQLSPALEEAAKGVAADWLDTTLTYGDLAEERDFDLKWWKARAVLLKRGAYV